jgi:hypothetical protein
MPPAVASLQLGAGASSYYAAQVISAELYSGPEVDVWSCGVTLCAARRTLLIARRTLQAVRCTLQAVRCTLQAVRCNLSAACCKYSVRRSTDVRSAAALYT